MEEFEVEETDGDGPGEPPAQAEADYNVAPTKAAPVVLERAPRIRSGTDQEVDAVQQAGEAGEPDDSRPVRWLRLLTWGLVPSWSKDRGGAARMINARADGLLDKPAFRRAAVARRCLVPADGWYEWQKSPVETDAKGRPRRQPFFIRPIIGGSIAFAGVYEFWRDPERDHDDPGAWLTTYAIVTVDAEPGLDVIHDRMPLVLPRDRWTDWLDVGLRDPDSVRALLVPPLAGRFEAVAVSTRVNASANNGPELLEALSVEELRGVVDPATGELIGGRDEPLF